MNQDELTKKLGDMILNSLDPYHSFTTPESKEVYRLAAVEYYEGEYAGQQQAAGFGGINPDAHPGQVLYEDLCDDFRNCGGQVLHRIPDLMKLYPLITKDELEMIIELMADQMAGELFEYSESKEVTT